MSYEQRAQKAKRWAVARGFMVTAIITAVLAVPWYLILAPMSFYAALVIVPVTGVYCIVWLLVVGFFLRQNPAGYTGAVLFVVAAVAIYPFNSLVKRYSELELVSKLKTSRIIEQPLSKVSSIALANTNCLTASMCQRALMRGLTDQVIAFQKLGGDRRDKFDEYEWKIELVRIKERPNCRLPREDFGKHSSQMTKHYESRQECFYETSFIKTGNLYELIENAILLKFGRYAVYETRETLPRVKTAIAKEVAGGKIEREIARWDYKRSHILGKEFGTKFNRYDFVRALFGMAPLKK